MFFLMICSPGFRDKWRSRIHKNFKQGETTKTKITWGMKKVITNGLWDRKWLLIHESKIQGKLNVISILMTTLRTTASPDWVQLISVHFFLLLWFVLLLFAWRLFFTLAFSALRFCRLTRRKDFPEMTYDSQMTSTKKKERKDFDRKNIQNMILIQ